MFKNVLEKALKIEKRLTMGLFNTENAYARGLTGGAFMGSPVKLQTSVMKTDHRQKVI